jgi:GT2 family glycosyltransferase
MDISLLITTHQRGHLLEQSLDRLLGLTLPAELVVVDDGGDDATPEIVAEFGTRSGVETRYIYTHNPGSQLCAHARNVGVKAATHDWIVTAEPELCFRTDALAQFAELQSQHPNDVISSGRVWFAPEGHSPNFTGEPGWELAGDYTPPQGSQDAIGWVAPYSALWNRAWLLEVGGWDEGFPGNWGWDDIDLLTRLRLCGHGQYIALEIEGVHLFHGLGGDTDFINEKYFRAKSFSSDESNLTDLVANKEREWGVAKPRP